MSARRSYRRWSGALALLAVAGCSTAPQPFMGSPERGQMGAHFDLAVQMRGAAIDGDLPRFRGAAQELADLDPARDLSPEVHLQLGPMRWEARAGADARTAEAAAQATAEVARTCGDCHRANNVVLGDRLVVTTPPPNEDADRHMSGLAWVTRLLWQGLIVPSDAAWAVAAESLTEPGALSEELLSGLPAREVQLASERLQRLGREASGATEPDDRVRALGEIWAVCSGCHATWGGS